MQRSLFRMVGAAISILLLAGTVYATPITMINGAIGVGGFDPGEFNTLGNTLPTLTGNVGVATGDLAALSGSSITFNGFTFNPAPSPVVNPLWSLGGFSFALDSVSVTVQNSTQLGLKGMGSLAGAGFASTPGEWSLSLDKTASPFAFFTYSSVTSAAPVPEPGTLLLLGSGLAGVAWYARRRKQQ